MIWILVKNENNHNKKYLLEIVFFELSELFFVSDLLKFKVMEILLDEKNLQKIARKNLRNILWSEIYLSVVKERQSSTVTTKFKIKQIDKS